MKRLLIILPLLGLWSFTTHCKSEAPQRPVVGSKAQEKASPSSGPGAIATPDPMKSPLDNSADSGVDAKPVDPIDTTGSDPAKPKPMEMEKEPEPDQVPPGKPIALTANLDLTPISIRVGSLNGWAADKNNAASELEVKFYLDGDNKTGKLIGTSQANRTGTDDGVEGEHAFYFTVPTEFKDSKPHKVFVYVGAGGAETPLSPKVPYTMTFFKPKGGAAKEAFVKTGMETGCGCHSNPPYEERWEMLNRDGTAKGWSQDNNYLYNILKNGHRGRTFKVKEISDWWNAEFAP